MKLNQQLSRPKLARVAAMFSILALTIVASAQRKDYSWMELPKKDADRMLANSPWSQTQVDTDLTEMMFSPTKAGTPAIGQSTPKGSVSDQQSINNNRSDRGALNGEVHVSYRICFLSARPVRQALAKTILASQGENNDQLVKQLQDFVERDFSSYIAIAVTINS